MYSHRRQGSDSAAFKELTKRDAQVQLAKEVEKLLKTCVEDREVTFDTMFIISCLTQPHLILIAGCGEEHEWLSPPLSSLFE